LTETESLARRAQRNSVDPNDSSLRLGLQRLEAAQRLVAAGDDNEARQAASESRVALVRALATAPRAARIGSEQAEVDLAVGLCARSAAPCVASDFDDEKARTVMVLPFVLDEHEVTNAEFERFAAATGFQTEAELGDNPGLYELTLGPNGWRSEFRPGKSWKTLRDEARGQPGQGAQLPVRGIDFAAAVAYCRWRAEQNMGMPIPPGQSWRLPTEEEWEFAARGPERRIFPWGDDPSQAPKGANSELPPSIALQRPTGRNGERGLGGSLWEWVSGGVSEGQLLRGASWLDNDVVHERLAQRRLVKQGAAHVDSGFRCARSTEAWPDAAAKNDDLVTGSADNKKDT
jgi:formylglycine-generating enzyme required for sulfatase activity